MRRDFDKPIDKSLKTGRTKVEPKEKADANPRLNYRYKVMGTLTVVAGGVSVRQKIYRVRSMKKLSFDN